MRRYGKIETAFWQNPKVRKLSDNAKLLSMYLIACPHGNAAGCFIVLPAYIAADLKWTEACVVETLSELSRNGFVRVDADSNMVSMPGWWGHNTIENPNVAKNVVGCLDSLPSSRLKYEHIKITLEHNGFSDAVRETLSKRLCKPFRNPEPEPEPKPEPDITTLPGDAISPFQEIYDAGCAICPALASANTSAIHAWIAAGADPTLDAIPEIKRLAAAGKSIRGWNYFTGAVMDAKATRTNPLPEGKSHGASQNRGKRTVFDKFVEGTNRAMPARPAG